MEVEEQTGNNGNKTQIEVEEQSIIQNINLDPVV
jgi:hypothetical protein